LEADNTPLELRYQKDAVLQTIGRRLKDNDGDAEFRQVLEGKITVNRHKDIKLSLTSRSNSPF
jgi:hypothetical protein